MRKMVFIVLSCLFLSVLFFNCGTQKTEEQLLNEAQNYAKEEKFEKALVTFEKLLVKYPQSKFAPEVYFQIATVASNLSKADKSNFDKAIDAYQKIVELYPDSSLAPKSQFMIGYTYANHKADTSKARVAYRVFLEKYAQYDSGLTASAKFELDYMGKDLESIPFLKNATTPAPETAKESKPAIKTKTAKGN
ncbi:tetratricopeptide repeat protein [candidate division KSB1 bacterium]|nr:tetratricopeptide repeat protein [candidate division KSB1 bacterium]